VDLDGVTQLGGFKPAPNGVEEGGIDSQSPLLNKRKVGGGNLNIGGKPRLRSNPTMSNVTKNNVRQREQLLLSGKKVVLKYHKPLKG